MDGAVVAKVDTLDDLRKSLKFAESEVEEYGTLYNYWSGRVKELRNQILTRPPTTSGEEGGR